MSPSVPACAFSSSAAPKNGFESDAFEAMHAAAGALHKNGSISKATMRVFDEAAFVEPEALTPAQMRNNSRNCSPASGAVRATIEHECEYGREMGDRSETAERTSAQNAERHQEARCDRPGLSVQRSSGGKSPSVTRLLSHILDQKKPASTPRLAFAERPSMPERHWPPLGSSAADSRRPRSTQRHAARSRSR